MSEYINSGIGKETRALLRTLNEIKTVLVGETPQSTTRGELVHNQIIINKASTGDTTVNTLGFNLIGISVSKGADLTDVSYTFKSLQNKISNSVEAATLNKVVGLNKNVVITNDTAQSGEFIYVDMWSLPPAYLPAITFQSTNTVFEDSSSDSQGANNSLSTLSFGMLADTYPATNEFNMQRGKTTTIALAETSRDSNTTSANIPLFNCNALYLELYVDSISGGETLTIKLNLVSRVNDAAYIIGSSGTFSSSKLFCASPGVFQQGGIDGVEEFYTVPLPDLVSVTVEISGGSSTYGVNLIQC